MAVLAERSRESLALTVLANAHAASRLEELERLLVQDMQLILPSDAIGLVRMEDGDLDLAAFGAGRMSGDERDARLCAARLATPLAQPGAVTVATAEGHCSGIADEDRAEATAVLQAAGFSAVVAIPLISREQPIGALLFLFGAHPIPRTEDLEPVARMAPVLASAIDRLCTECPPKPSGKRARWRKRSKLAVILLLLACFPLPFRVGGEVVVSARNRSYLYAGIDAPVRSIEVRDGQFVKKGTLIARLDGRDLSYEIRSKERERRRFASELSILENLAQAEPAREAERRLVELELQVCEERVRFLKEKRSLLELRAEVAGVVVLGQSRAMIGKRLARDEALCRIEPEEDFEVSLYVNEEDYARVGPGQKMQIRLAAESGSRELSVTRRVPLVETEGEHAGSFQLRGRFEGRSVGLRSGMRGTGWVDLGWRPMAFVLFRRMASRIARQLPF